MHVSIPEGKHLFAGIVGLTITQGREGLITVHCLYVREKERDQFQVTPASYLSNSQYNTQRHDAAKCKQALVFWFDE